MAAALNVVLGRSRRSAWIAALLAAFVSGMGFAVYVIVFFLTVPDEFFN